MKQPNSTEEQITYLITPRRGSIRTILTDRKKQQKYYFQNEGKQTDKTHPMFHMNGNCVCCASIVYIKIKTNKNFGKQRPGKQKTTLEAGDEGGSSRI